MNCRNESFPASIFHTQSSRDVEARTYQSYSNPLRITPASSAQSVNHGLGISYPEMDATSSLRDYPTSEPYAADWTSQLMPSALPYGCAPNNNQVSPATFCENYIGSDASASPLSFCGPQAMSASSSHGSALDIQAGPEGLNMKAYNFWPNTPLSDADIVIKEDPDAEFQEGLYLECAKPVSMPLFAPVAQYRTTDFWPKLEYPEEDDANEPTGIDYDADSSLLVESSLPIDPFGYAGEDNVLQERRRPRVPPASGNECTLCGAKFTRRSNCREHMKRHDPNNRKTWACDACGKTLGRKTDLKRHIDSVHRGIRRFACDQCGARFSRQDTLARHGSDGCRRNGRRS
ncbi:hypothetical protein BDV19DRAFT_33962 [Aspergillus venezuelensis]